MTPLRNYFYLDESGIDSLYAQINTDCAQIDQIQTTNRQIGTADGNLSFGEIVSPVVSGGAELSGEKESIEVVNKTVRASVESKLQRLIEYADDCKTVCKSPDEICTDYQENEQNFVYLTMPFDTHFYRPMWKDTVDLVEKYGFIPFTAGHLSSVDEYVYDDSYYKKSAAKQLKIIMHLAASKLRPYQALTSHTAVWFAHTKGKNMNMGVFGHLYKLSEDNYQIKPYAVWRV